MKNLKFLFAGIFLTALVFSGCNKVEEALDVTFDANYKTNLNVEVGPGRSVTFYEKEEIDPASDPDVNKYWNKIKDFEVREITGTIIDISKNVTLETGTLSIYNNNRRAQWTFNNIPLTVGTSLTLDNAGGNWSTVSRILKDKQTFTVEVEGAVSDGDVKFTVLVTIKTKVTANPL